jgi:hypothetical protein
VKDIIAAALIAGAILCAAGLQGANGRFEVLPTPRGTIILDKLEGHAYQEPALPMFREAR